MNHSEELYRDLGIDPPERPRVVLHQDGTEEENQYQRESNLPAFSESDADALWGATKSYVVIKKERPAHRIMLWHMLQGRKKKEIAVLMRCSYQTVCNVTNQPWFLQAFARMSSEMGRDVVETYLKGEELPTVQVLINMRDDEKTPSAVRKAVCTEILDRIRGKPTVFVKTESQSSVDVTVADVSTLLAERAANEQKLKANGIVTGPN